MRLQRFVLLSWLMLAGLLLSGCVQPLPRNMSFQQLLEQDHPIARIQQRQADKLLQDMQVQGVFFEHVELRALTERILQRLFPGGEHKALSIRFARMPGENAFALPIGEIVFHLALLAALENEEQYAFVLAHEAVHVLENHSLQGANNRRGKRVAAHLTDLLTLGSGRTYRHFAESIQKFSREQEYVADLRALEVMRAAGYNVSIASGFFDLLDQYPLAVNVNDGLRSHPSNDERRRRLHEHMTADDHAQRSRADHKGFDALRRLLLKRSIRDKIEEQDFPAALVQVSALEHLKVELTVTECLRGDVFLALSHDEEQSRQAFKEVVGEQSVASLLAGRPTGDTDTNSDERSDTNLDAMAGGFFAGQAKLSYADVLLSDADAPCAMRGLGLLHHASGDRVLSDHYLRAYLQSKPEGAFGRHAKWLIKTNNLAAAASDSHVWH